MPILKMSLKECVLGIIVHHHHGIQTNCDSGLEEQCSDQTRLMDQTIGIMYTEPTQTVYLLVVPVNLGSLLNLPPPKNFLAQNQSRVKSQLYLVYLRFY